MSPENGIYSPDSEYHGGLKTDLSLAPPGCAAAQAPRPPAKRGYAETVDLDLGTTAEVDASVVTHKSSSKAQVVGWPPVGSYRKNMMKGCKFVKVAVDGAPYLRKIDLESCTGYKDLLAAFEDMFVCLNTRDVMNEKKVMDCANAARYVPTYEDRDGDWMLVGDVPWK
ncbi:Auxin-responsive protein IAA14 [Striga hermonthica]|uniref:Auxin-responsive protein n=1 Tax=Striga hermonthica TaxID=68872 RepID=A0A9N7NKI1_STRHE|nr:Auxin-responsive protein IAA14 [Striga hermonthica]